MKQVNVGIVGCGMVARYHAKAISETPNAYLIGACSKTFSSTLAFCKEFSETKAFEDYTSMLSDSEINTIAICSPSGEHFFHAQTALMAGKNVIIEKPFCLNTNDADILINLAREKHLEICCISQSRFSDAAMAVKQTIENNQLGKLVSCSLMMRYMRDQAYYDQASWRGTFAFDGGGILMNQGIHGIDLLCYLIGSPKSVTGFVKTQLRKIEGEDTAAIAIEFKNGAIGVIDATVCSKPSFKKKFIISGEKGTIILEDDAILLWDLPIACPISIGKSINGSSASDPKGISHAYHAREYLNYTRHILYSEPLLVNGDQGKMPLSVILGVYESSRTGKTVIL